MAFLHSHSDECFKSELSLFSLPHTQTSIEATEIVHYKPVSSSNDNAPLEFVISSSGESYIDLAHTMLSLRVQI